MTVRVPIESIALSGLRSVSDHNDQVMRIMEELGFAGAIRYSDWNYYNGTREGRYIATNAIQNLSEVLASHGLPLSQGWAEMLRGALNADIVNTASSDEPWIDNAFLTLCYAIEDSIRRKEGEEPLPVSDAHFMFENPSRRQIYESIKRGFDELSGLLPPEA